jgi:hypothetical protein
MPINMNGLRTELAKNKKTIFIALPSECWRPIEGGCGCDWCKSHPDQVPQWDTLVVNPQPSKRPEYTSVCHYPEFSQPFCNRTS